MLTDGEGYATWERRSIEVLGDDGFSCDEAIAAINRGGDPVEILNRAARRKAWMLAIVMTLAVAAVVFGVLVATGIVIFH